MGIKIEIPTNLLEFGGLKVSMQSALSDSIDSITNRRRSVQGNVFTGTRTANNVYNITGLRGTTFLLVHVNVTALTLTSGTLNFLIRRLMPNGTTMDCLLNMSVAATLNKLVQIHAQPDNTYRDIQAFGAATNTVYPGPWYDLVEFNFSGTGVYSVTCDINYIAY